MHASQQSEPLRPALATASSISSSKRRRLALKALAASLGGTAKDPSLSTWRLAVSVLMSLAARHGRQAAATTAFKS